MAGNAGLLQDFHDALVEFEVQLRWRVFACGEGAGEKDAVSPVVAVIHDTASGNAPAELQVIGKESFYCFPFLGVAEGNGGLGPAVMTKEGGFRWDAGEEGSIDCHVLGSVTKGVGQGDEHTGLYARRGSMKVSSSSCA